MKLTQMRDRLTMLHARNNDIFFKKRIGVRLIVVTAS